MGSILFEMAQATAMIAVVVILFVWFMRSEAAGAYRRRKAMMARVHVDPAIADSGDPKIQAAMKEVRARCSRCSQEGFCERWLAGLVEGPNTFCPNASTFRGLAGTPG